jgi:hypothetical protein
MIVAWGDLHRIFALLQGVLYPTEKEWCHIHGVVYLGTRTVSNIILGTPEDNLHIYQRRRGSSSRAFYAICKVLFESTLAIKSL